MPEPKPNSLLNPGCSTDPEGPWVVMSGLWQTSLDLIAVYSVQQMWGQEDARNSAVVAPALRSRPFPTSSQTAAVPHTLSLPVPMAASQAQLTECIVVYLRYFTVPRSLAV